MIIPIKCFTCGMVIADKYRYYVDKVLYLTKEFVEKTPEGEVLDDLNMNKMCCRRHFLTHVDIE